MYLIWTIGVFSMVGLTVGNLNAILMEPLGHIAGLAASVSSSVATVGAVVIAVPVGWRSAARRCHRFWPLARC